MLSSTVQSEAAAPYHLHLMPDADLTGTAGVQGQGPYLQLFAKVEADLVKEASYQTYSCPNAIACGSWVTRWMEGRGPDVLSVLTADDLMRVLGGIPLGKEHCAYLAVGALQDLLRKWAVGSRQSAVECNIENSISRGEI
jgi:NifU-like protein involved in Fe-S cluster formation